jgi:hypothetical protein
MLSSYPKESLGDSLDATMTKKRMNDGYIDACNDFTVEAIDKLLNS